MPVGELFDEIRNVGRTIASEVVRFARLGSRGSVFRGALKHERMGFSRLNEFDGEAALDGVHGTQRTEATKLHRASAAEATSWETPGYIGPEGAAGDVKCAGHSSGNVGGQNGDALPAALADQTNVYYSNGKPTVLMLANYAGTREQGLVMRSKMPGFVEIEGKSYDISTVVEDLIERKILEVGTKDVLHVEVNSPDLLIYENKKFEYYMSNKIKRTINIYSGNLIV